MKYVISGAMCRVMVPVWRIAIPKEIRDYFEITINSPMAIFYNEDSIILKRYEPDCIFCGKSEGLFHFNGKNICMACAIELKEIEKTDLMEIKSQHKISGSSSWHLKLKKEQRYIKEVKQSGIFLIPQTIRESMFISTGLMQLMVNSPNLQYNK